MLKRTKKGKESIGRNLLEVEATGMYIAERRIDEWSIRANEYRIHMDNTSVMRGREKKERE